MTIGRKEVRYDAPSQACRGTCWRRGARVCGERGSSPTQSLAATGVVADATVASTRTADGITFVVLNGVVTSNGTLTGEYVGVSKQVIRGDTGVDIIVYTFTGSTPCGTGSFVIRGGGKLTTSRPRTDTESGHFVSVADSSDTIGIHVNIDFTRVGLDLTFTGTYRCT